MALFGLDLPEGRGQVGGDADEYAAALHPDDRHLAADFHALADRQDSFLAEYRIVRPDGATLWLSGRGLVMSRRPDGRAERLVSIMADVSERKLAEESLRLDARADDPGAPGRADGRLRPRHRQRRALVGAADLRGVRRLARHLHADPRVGHRSGPSRTTARDSSRAACRRSPAGEPFVQEYRVRRGRTAASSGSATAARPSTTPAAGRCAASASRSTSPSASWPSRRCRRPTGGRTASSRRWRTSCAIRWRRSATPSRCCAAAATRIRRSSGAAA